MAAAGKLPANFAEAVSAKFRSLGLDGQSELLAFVRVLKIRSGIARGEDIVGAGSSGRLTVLLSGVACSYLTMEEGSRHIHAFQYPGDFCDLPGCLARKKGGALTVGALDVCSVGTIEYEALDHIVQEHPRLGLSLWRAAMLEASIVRERLTVSRRAARERVAHLLCEQLERLEATGVRTKVVPLTQIDLADAAGLSAVQTNRSIQELRSLELLSKGRCLEVTDRKQLAELAKFDNSYLNMPKVLADWTIMLA